MNDIHPAHFDLQAMAKQLMLENGISVAFPPPVAAASRRRSKAHPPQISPRPDIRDLRNLVWSSIDNDTSRDLDQIEVAERQPNGDVKVMVGIADVDPLFPRAHPSTQHAATANRDHLRRGPEFLHVAGGTVDGSDLAA